MLVHKIKKPVVRSVVAGILSHLLPSNPEPRLAGHGMILHMNKQLFAEWHKKHVEGKFSVGDLICYVATPSMANAIPHHFKITYINELWYQCKWHPGLNAPESLTCQTTAGFSVTKCASVMRRLTKEEVELVSLSNRKIQGTS